VSTTFRERRTRVRPGGSSSSRVQVIRREEGACPSCAGENAILRWYIGIRPQGSSDHGRWGYLPRERVRAWGSAEDRRRADLPLRLRQRAQLRGRPGRAARGAQLAPAGSARPVRGAAERYGLHRTAVPQPPLVAVPDPPVGRAPGVHPDPQRRDPHRSLHPDRARPEPPALEPPSRPGPRDRLPGRTVDAGRQRRRHPAHRRRRAPLFRQHLDGAGVQRRRR
jgi:hypothetical protein